MTSETALHRDLAQAAALLAARPDKRTERAQKNSPEAIPRGCS
ncbi:hypothetical protein [Jonquetella anthropi]|nr:hypothetical protein [Jonquetella anthropi]